ncbi:hypothetical protein P7C70_g482, partial [Phenoliferia sp. Uapishka_3]
MSFWKPGTVAPGSSIDRDVEAGAGGAGVGAVTGRVENVAVSQRSSRLPIAKERKSLLYLLEEHPVVILQSPTGTGKSTQLPQFLMEAGWASDGRTIGITQPRRVAAISVAQRVAEEVGCVLGQEVGYNIRFESLSTPETKILYLTDGMLFREILVDPLLSRYSVLMIDEAHERSIYTDLLLGVLKKIRRVRPALRIIISSATIDAQAFVDFFNYQPPSSSIPSSGLKASDEMLPPPSKRSRWDKMEKAPKDEAIMVRLEGRAFPVEIAYLEEPTADLVQKVIETVYDIHLQQPAGDILVFLTGREEIERCLQALADNMSRLPMGAAELLPLGLHSGLSTELQMAVFDPPPPRTRKVILSTNVAEASVTIEGIKYVIDSGLVKVCTPPASLWKSTAHSTPHLFPQASIVQPTHGNGRGVVANTPITAAALVTTPCSAASLAQRAGRAGRTSPGKCLRLFPSSILPTLLPLTPPEITRSDLSLLVLQLKSLGIQNVLRFDWMTAPSAAMLERALEFLYSLGALDEDGKLTNPLGVQMAELPIDVMMGKINVFIMDGDNVSGELERRKFTAEEGDHLTYLNAFNAFVKCAFRQIYCSRALLTLLGQTDENRASGAMQRVFRIISPLHLLTSPLTASTEFQSTLPGALNTDAAQEISPAFRDSNPGYFRNAAKLMPDGTYRSVREGAVLHAHPTSVLFTRIPTKQFVIYHEVIETTKRFMRDMTSIEQDWLPELAPHYYSFKSKQ